MTLVFYSENRSPLIPWGSASIKSVNNNPRKGRGGNFIQRIVTSHCTDVDYGFESQTGDALLTSGQQSTMSGTFFRD